MSDSDPLDYDNADTSQVLTACMSQSSLSAHVEYLNLATGWRHDKLRGVTDDA
jgi:hypothetical protein